MRSKKCTDNQASEEVTWSLQVLLPTWEERQAPGRHSELQLCTRWGRRECVVRAGWKGIRKAWSGKCARHWCHWRTEGWAEMTKQASIEWKVREVATPREKCCRTNGLGEKVQVRMVDSAEARWQQPLCWPGGVWTSRFDLGVKRIQDTDTAIQSREITSWLCSSSEDFRNFRGEPQTEFPLDRLHLGYLKENFCKAKNTSFHKTVLCNKIFTSLFSWGFFVCFLWTTVKVFYWICRNMFLFYVWVFWRHMGCGMFFADM